MRPVAALAIIVVLFAVSTEASDGASTGEKKSVSIKKKVKVSNSKDATITTGAKKTSKSSKKSSKKALKAVAETGVTKLLKIETDPKKKEKYVFDPMHLHFGNDPQMKKLKHSLYMSAGSLTEQLKGPATTEKGKALAAATALSNKNKEGTSSTLSASSKKSLRAGSTDEATEAEKEARRKLSASLWETMFGGFASPFVKSETELEEEEDKRIGLGASNSSLPQVDDVVEKPDEEDPIPEDTDEKPKKRSLKYFESKFYGDQAECKIKHNTFFTSHTFGVDACFPSSLSTDCFPVWTASSYREVLNEEEDMQHSYSVLTRFYYDAACENEWDHDGYFPIEDVLSSECDEKENLEKGGIFEKVSKESVLWELSHAPHRETAGHQMSISLYAKGHDCRAGQADVSGEYNTLQERLTFSHASETCMENDDGHSYFMKCLPEGEVTIHAFDNPNCEGKEVGTALLTRDELCHAEWSGIYTQGMPVVQCGIGENWNNPGFSKGKDFVKSHHRITDVDGRHKEESTEVDSEEEPHDTEETTEDESMKSEEEEESEMGDGKEEENDEEEENGEEEEDGEEETDGEEEEDGEEDEDEVSILPTVTK